MRHATVSKARRARAIRWAVEHRQIHQQWVRWCRKYPHRPRNDAGGVRHHLQAIARYDEIIRLLRAVPTRPQRRSATRRAR